MTGPQKQFRWPTEPKPVKPPRLAPETWVFAFTPMGPDNGVPAICRIRKLLKAASRAYQLRARIVSEPPPATAQVIAQPPVAASAATKPTGRANQNAKPGNGH